MSIIAVSTTFSRSTSSLRRSRSRRDAGFVDASIGGDAGALDFLARGDLGLLQRLHSRDLELLDRAPPFEPRGFEHLLALDVALLDLLLGDDFGLPHLPIGVDPLGFLRRERDHAVLVGDLDRLLLFDVEHFARLLRGDAVGLERQLDADALALDGVAAPQFGRFDRLGAGDLEATSILLGPNALGGDRFFLRDSGRFDRLTRRDVGRLDRPVARDFERADRALPAQCASPRSTSRAAMPASSTVWLRAISSERVACSAAMRSAARILLARDLRRLDRLLSGDLRLLDRPRARDFQRARALVGRDPLGVDRRHLRNAQLLGRLARGDLGFLERARAFDLAPARLLFVDDARFGHRAFLQDARLLDDFARLDLRLFDRAGALDLGLSDLALGSDARGIDRTLVGDARLLDSLARRDLDLLDRARALDFLLPDLALGGDARFADRLLVGDARLFDRLARGDLRLLGFGLAQRALAGDLGPLHGALHLDVALLGEPSRLAVALDVQRLPLGLEIAGADLDHRILFDVVAQLAPLLDVLHQAGQAFGVEAVRRIEEFEIGLVEIGDRDRFQLEAVLRQRLGRGAP